MAEANAGDGKSPQRRSRKDVGKPELSADGKTKSYTVHGKKFEVDAVYDVKKVVGYGAYGTVCAAVDTRTNSSVAIKKMSSVFDDLIDGKRVLREMKVLSVLKHPNILDLKTALEPVNPEAFQDVYFVTNLMEADLQYIIRSKQKLLDAHCRYFIGQLLRALRFMHAANIVHRDLKPSNLLVNSTCELVLCDFGLARSVDEPTLTGYVVTRWYRAPELLVLGQNYAFPVDMWSVGCILSELLLRKPLFQGTNYLEQLAQVLKVVGTPTDSADLSHVSAEAKRYIGSLKKYPPADINEIFRGAAQDAIDLVGKLLQFNPSRRPTAVEAGDHAYLRKVRYATPDPTPLSPKTVADVDGDLSETSLRQAFLDTIRIIRSKAAMAEASSSAEEKSTPPAPSAMPSESPAKPEARSSDEAAPPAKARGATTASSQPPPPPPPPASGS